MPFSQFNPNEPENFSSAGPSGSERLAAAALGNLEQSPVPESQSFLEAQMEVIEEARAAYMDRQLYPRDRRARIGGARQLFQDGSRLFTSLMGVLEATDGLMFPYTPSVIYNRTTSYDDFHFTHSNYKYNQFRAGSPGEIQITGEFTAQTTEEAVYLLAAIRFLKTMQLSEFGKRSGSKRGAPPPVLRFNYLGPEVFNNVPVVISMANFTFEQGVDYVPVRGFDTWVPSKMMLVCSLLVQPNPQQVLEEFTVRDFKNGNLVRKGYI